ncbi:ATP-binding protein [Halorientalis litorea]|uniref:ATP-binding protein n=1 Tax=Halorientalis litorea TaxID=2931977 RepID=UPI001FF1F88A|nr:ATP-binding protein [Halorientalis litorea]
MVDFAAGKKPSQAGPERPDFGAIVGQRELKRALLVVAVNDAIDGVLVRGEKGTAKSTAVRALVDLLPTQQAVADCPYGCHPTEPSMQCASCLDRTDPPVEERAVPLVTLPLGATRDRVVGTLSVGDALDGTKEFEPGLLARAHRGILYVDEVNLLDDHLVDVLLDAAASGVNRVERDGVSVSHPADFTLVGTMNPEEGDLRPQLRDRFAVQVEVTGCPDIDDRVAIIEQAVDGEADRDAEPTDYGRKLRTARDRLDDVTLPESFAADIAELCRDAGVDGHRGDIATARTARTLAALDGRTNVLEPDVRRAAELALPHRLQSRPFEDAPDPEDVVEDHFEDESAEGGDGDTESQQSPADGATGDEDGGDSADTGDDDAGADGEAEEGDAPRDGDDGASPEENADGDAETDTEGTDADPSQDPGADSGAAEASSGGDDRDADGPDADADDADRDEATPIVPGGARAGVGESAAPDLPQSDALDTTADSGSRSGGATDTARGSRVRTKPADTGDSVDAAASVRAAARRGSDAVDSRDLRASVRASDTGALVLFVVDASASMHPAMRAAKGTVLELLKDAYQHRDEVGFVAVAGDSADVVLPPTDSVSLAARHLKDLPTGDRTPLPDGLRTAAEVLDRADPASAVVVLVTDGRANVADGSPTAETRRAARELADRDASLLLVDAGDDGVGVTDHVLDATDGRRVPLSALSADRVDAAVDES